MRARAIYCGFVCAFTVHGTPSYAAETKNFAADSEWTSYNHRLNGVRFSGLTQINTANVGALEEVCHVKLAEAGSLSTGPLLVNGVMYVTMDNITAAIDPRSCRIIWKAEYEPDQEPVLSNNRGVAFLSGSLFRGTEDGRLVSYDADTGRERWRRQIGDPAIGEFASAAPIAWDGLVFLGMSGGGLGTRGRIAAFDAQSGATRWTFDLVPRSDQFGANTWAGHSAEHGGGATWSSYTLDEGTGELFVSVDNPAPTFNGSIRAGANLFTDSLVVLNAKTGLRRWHIQLRKHDTLDYGVSPPAVLITVHGRPLIAQGSKDGYLYVIDRKDRRVVYKTAVTTIKAGISRPPQTGTEVCPGISGGFLYNSPSFDPGTGTLISGTVDWCSRILLDRSPPQYEVRREYLGGRQEHVGRGSGWITSVDAANGRIVWRFHTDFPVFAAVTSTAGGLTFSGDHGGHVYAFRTADGSMLWERRVPGSIAGGIITYQIGSKQYVGVASGNTTLSPSVASAAPTIIIYGLTN
jgi:PQQ-dependent dehydrogenase (methanol/ethanol family)